MLSHAETELKSFFANRTPLAANQLRMNPAKTELLQAGTKHNVSLLGCHVPTLQLGSNNVTPSNHVRVLGQGFSNFFSPWTPLQIM